MLPRIFSICLASAGFCMGQQGDAKGARMDPVVPNNLIPPSPVLSVKDALKSFKLLPGFVIEPVAAEPLVEMPVCLDFDASGRMWICEMRGYMPDIDGKGEKVPLGRIVILADLDHDGKADTRTVFLENLHLPRAISVQQDGILFIDEKRLCWVRRNGDQPAGDVVELDAPWVKSGNVEHKPNGLLSNLDNRLYLAKSDKRLRRVGEVWEIENTTFRGQWGIARDDFGRLYHNNNSTLLFADLLAPNLLLGNPGVRFKSKDYQQLGSNQVWPARVTPGVNRAYVAKAHGYDQDTLDPKTFRLINTTAAAGMTIYRGSNFPTEWQGTGFTAEPVSNLVKATRISEREDDLTGSHFPQNDEFLTSTDERFRPVNLYNGPDGALYLLDMYHGIIQHSTYMTSYLREQMLARDLDRPGIGLGRIYRIRSEGGSLERDQNLSSRTGVDLVKFLAHTNAWHRETAQRLLVERKDPEAIPPLEKLAVTGQVVSKIHAIWTLEGMGSLRGTHLETALGSSDSKLQSSALWATTRLHLDELRKLESSLIACVPAGREVLPYLARALGPLGSEKSHRRLADLLKSNPDVPLLREAAVSGLDPYEKEFASLHLGDSKDNELKNWLQQASDNASPGSGGNDLSAKDLASYNRGKSLFHGVAACIGCHGADGAGMPTLGPPLNQSEWVTGKPAVLIRILLQGMSGPVKVNGEIFNPVADMPGLGMNPEMNDQAIADLSTYIRNEWSNKAPAVTPSEISYVRKETKNRGSRPWTEKELQENPISNR